MSTRCNIVIKDSYGDDIILYRHSDGYPEGVAATLGEFLSLIRAKKIRNNASQSVGWLIVLGHEEYNKSLSELRRGAADTNFSGWKVGAYEPSTQIHGDIEYLYEIDLSKETITAWHMDWVGGDQGVKKGRKVDRELARAFAAAGFPVTSVTSRPKKAKAAAK